MITLTPDQRALIQTRIAAHIDDSLVDGQPDQRVLQDLQIALALCEVLRLGFTKATLPHRVMNYPTDRFGDDVEPGTPPGAGPVG